MRSVRLCAAVGVAALPACTIVAPLDGLSGNLPSTERAEASPDHDAGASNVHSDFSADETAGDAALQDDSAAPSSVNDVRDGGVADAAAADVTDADVAPDPCATALLCDDFERGLQLGLWPSQSIVGGTIGVDTLRAHSGTHALHAHTDSVDGGSTPGVSVLHSGALPSDYFIRVWVYTASPAPPFARNLLTTIQAQAPYWGMSLGINFDGTLAMTAWTDSASSFQNSMASTPAVDRWVCLEWETTGSGGVGTTHVWMDGAPVGDLTLANLPFATFAQTGLGVSYYQVTTVPASDEWFDDLVITTSFVPCWP
jgi:hypothetical protein